MALYSEYTRALTFENARVIAGRHSNIFFSSVAKDDILPRTGLQSVFFFFFHEKKKILDVRHQWPRTSFPKTTDLQICAARPATLHLKSSPQVFCFFPLFSVRFVCFADLCGSPGYIATQVIAASIFFFLSSLLDLCVLRICAARPATLPLKSSPRVFFFSSLLF